MDGLRLVPGGFQRFKGLHEQSVLLGSVGDILLGGIIGHREVLEQAGHFQPGQFTHGQHLADGGVKVGAQGKTDASHAGVGLEVDLHPSACLYGCSGKVLRLLGGVAGRRDIFVDKGLGVFRLHMA